MKKFKVLVTYVEAGMGHIVSAKAVSDALVKYYPDEVEVENCNIFSDSKNPLLIRHERYLVNKVKSFYKHKHYLNFFIFLAGRILPPRVTINLVHSTKFRKERKATAGVLMQKSPDMVISTHYSPLHYAVYAQKKMGARFLTAHYNPDPCVHYWNDNRADVMIVNNALAYRQAIDRLRFTDKNCALGKFALRSAVQDCVVDKQAMRKKYGINGDSFTVVMADGAYASAKLKPIAKRLLGLGARFTLIVIAGVNAKIHDFFKGKIGKIDGVDIKVFGFTDKVHELYMASDLFITKAGPNALLDSVCVETPVMVTYHSGQIELFARNLFVDEYKTGVVAENADEAERYFLEFYKNPQLLQPYVENCRRFKRENVDSKAVADQIVQRLREREAEIS